MIAIIDYGMGNLRSVHKAFEHLGLDAAVTRDKKKIASADKVVLPGVGAFKDCMKNLETFGLIDPVVKSIRSGKPFLGICLGMQLLFTESEEFGRHEGLNLIPGKVVRFPQEERLKVPQIGWNQIWKKKEVPFLKEIPQDSYVYFVHSYYVVPKDPKVIATQTNYGVEFCSSVSKDNIFATQFHPEKSQAVGLKILKAFGEA
jgi:imidazole glycerol-phosphate synthase subunit HisH